MLQPGLFGDFLNTATLLGVNSIALEWPPDMTHSKCSECLANKGPQQRGITGAKGISIIVMAGDEIL